MFKHKFCQFSVLSSFILVLSIFLTACGEAATPTMTQVSSPTPIATVTTSLTTVSTPTISATTLAPSTTMAATGLALPAFPDVIDVELNEPIAQGFTKALGITNYTAKMYVSDDEPSRISDITDIAMRSANYQFSLLGFNKPMLWNNAYTGVYTHSGSQDVLVYVTPASEFVKSFAGISSSDPNYQKYVKPIENKKTFVMLIIAPNIVPALSVLVSRSQTPNATEQSTLTTLTPVPVTFQYKYKSQDALDAIKAAGLEAEKAVPLTKEDYGNASPFFAVDAIHFYIPSLGPDNGGRIFSFNSQSDLDRTRMYYDESGWIDHTLYSWTFSVENILVQINGNLDDTKAKQYEQALSKLGKVIPSVRNSIPTTMPPNPVFNDLPTLPGLLEVKVPLRYSDSLLMALGEKDGAVKTYASDDEPDKVAATLDQTLANAGYKFSLPGQAKPFLTAEGISGNYVKSGQLDVYFLVLPVANVVGSGVAPDMVKVVEQLKGKKTFVSIFMAKDIVSALLNSAPKATPSVVSTTIPVSTTNISQPPAATPIPYTPTPAAPAVATSIAQNGFVLEVTGTNGIQFSGTCLSFSSSGSSSSQDANGTVPAIIIVKGGSNIGSCVVQKQGENGELKVRLFRNGSIVAEGTTSQAYGVVSVAGR